MKNALQIIAGLILVAIVAGGAYYLGQNVPGPAKTKQVIQNTITPQSTPTPTNPQQQTGTIEGSLSFPSEGIPVNMQVCAEDSNTQQNYCTNEHFNDNKYTYGVGYKIEVPSGSYFVYAQVPNFGNGYRAYYNEFVTCGLSVNCQSHENIEVNVSAGQTITGIDPQDWYNQQ